MNNNEIATETAAHRTAREAAEAAQAAHRANPTPETRREALAAAFALSAADED